MDETKATLHVFGSEEEPVEMPDAYVDFPCYESREVLHVFTNEEKEELAKAMAKAQIDADTLDNERKRTNAGYKRKIDTLRAESAGMAKTYADGCEYRYMDCPVVILNGVKTVTHPDTGDVIEKKLVEDRPWKTP